MRSLAAPQCAPVSLRDRTALGADPVPIYRRPVRAGRPGRVPDAIPQEIQVHQHRYPAKFPLEFGFGPVVRVGQPGVPLEPAYGVLGTYPFT